ncbi:MAG: ABC-2 transporter permease [Oscillospiraceae bacterium]|nr:ABC-2 transporter permease [Oscillospiraceae bacterium]
MKGLIIKDFYTLIKQMKIYICMIIIFSIIPGFSAFSFGVVYASMMPITACAYDERSKWNTLAGMMPYKVSDIVLSKYMLGYIFIGACTVLGLLSSFIMETIKNTSVSGFENISALLGVMSIALIMVAVNMPAMFRFGVEKGRFVMMVIIAIGVSAAYFTDSLSKLGNQKINQTAVSLLVVLAAVVFNVLSVMLSITIYRKRVR